MTTVEFVEVQKLSPEALRTRFSLPGSCDPTVTALATDPGVNLVTVAVDCRVKPGGVEPIPASSERHPPSRRPDKGPQR
jgi:hypothetical protein